MENRRKIPKLSTKAKAFMVWAIVIIAVVSVGYSLIWATTRETIVIEGPFEQIEVISEDWIEITTENHTYKVSMPSDYVVDLTVNSHMSLVLSHWVNWYQEDYYITKIIKLPGD